MKQFKRTIVAVLCAALLSSCGSNADNQPATAKGFTEIEAELKSEFGNDAYYTDLAIIYHESIGNSITATVTGDPKSLRMGQWTYSLDKWTQTSEVTLEIPDGTAAADFMFQLADEINLNKLGRLVEVSKQELTDTKEIMNSKLEMAFIKFPKDGNIENAKYVVKLQPENGGTSFTFQYQLDGVRINMDY